VVAFVVTSPLSLGRVMWWYGEDTLWGPALELAPVEVADLAPRFASLLADHRLLDELWHVVPRLDAHLVLGTIEHFEGRVRPPARLHRRGGPMPDVLDLDLSEEARWRDPALAEGLRLVDERTGMSQPRRPELLRPRLHGRWASG
jgi:hypothetical protein